MLLYADDTILYTSSNSVIDAMRETKMLLNKLSIWCSLNRLSLIIEKTKHMLIQSNKDDYQILNHDVHNKICVNGESLEDVHKYIYLGVVVDEHHSFIDFID